MPRTYDPEELEAIRETELHEAARAADRARSGLVAPPGYVKLYDPKLDHLKYGDRGKNDPEATSDTLIVFGEVEAGVAIVRVDHPLLPGLMRRHPRVQVYESGETPGKTFACPDCSEEFRSRPKFQTHFRLAHGPSAPPAQRPAKATHGQAAARPAPRIREAQEVTPEQLLAEEAPDEAEAVEV